MKTILIILVCCLSFNVFSQKKPLIENHSQVTGAAIDELNEQMQPPEGLLYEFKTEFNIKGEYVMDITIHEKGKVANVFCAGNDGGNIKSQNRVKDFVKDYQFNFKMPKGKKYKFQYIFKFE